jgi:tRNA wybutosine-synthesizing protein 3
MLGTDIVDDIVGGNAPAAAPGAVSPSNPAPAADAKKQPQQQQQQQNQQQLHQYRKLLQINAQNDKAFDARKQVILSDLSKTAYCDLSPKGSVDVGCLPLMQLLNAHADYVSTSSCSGRISVFDMAVANNNKKQHEAENEDATAAAAAAAGSTGAKRGVADVATGWVHISHDPVSESEMAIIHDKIDAYVKRVSGVSSAAFLNQLTFLVEPFVMHVSCRNTAAAQVLLAAAVQAGFRNSGAVLGASSTSSSTSSSCSALSEPPNKITVAIRHTAHLSAPLVIDNVPFASRQYVDALLRKGNAMMHENEARIVRLHSEIAKRLGTANAASVPAAAAAAASNSE